MAVVENRFVCDLSKPVQAQALKGNVFSLDNLGSRLSVLIYDNGRPATISGSVTANCILPDGSTENVNGSLTTENGGSKAYVDIPQSCLLIPGLLKIAIKCTSSSVITTLAAIVANVYMTKTDNIITPSQQIINDWNAEISASLANQDAEISDLKSAIDNDVFRDRTTLTNSDNLNNIVTAGAYAWTSNSVPLNTPFNGSANLLVFVTPTTGTAKRIIQISETDKTICYRIRAGSSWYPWRYLANDYLSKGIQFEPVETTTNKAIQETPLAVVTSSDWSLSQLIEIPNTVKKITVFFSYEQSARASIGFFKDGTLATSSLVAAYGFTTNSSEHSTEYTVPEGAKFFAVAMRQNNSTNNSIMSVYASAFNYGVDQSNVDATAEEKVDLLKNELMYINRMNPADGKENKYLSLTVGSPISYSTSNEYNSSGLIPCDPETTYYIFNRSLTKLSARFVAEFGADGNCISYQENKKQFTTGENARYIAYTWDSENALSDVMCMSIAMSDSFYEYGNGIIREELLPQESKNTYCFTNSQASMSDGDTLIAISNINNKKNNTVCFYAEVDASAFGSVSVGHGYNLDYGSYVKIDDTYITTFNGTSQYYQVEHNLTIDKFLYVEIHQEDNARASIFIASSDGSKKVNADLVAWDGCRGSVFAKSTNSTLANCKIDVSFADFLNDIYIFGDSYLSLGDPKRWPYYLIQNGYTKVCLNGYGGVNSNTEMKTFRNIIAVAKPKYVIWLLGMNDMDDGQINESYKLCLNEVISTCEGYGIIPILATIPNVANTTYYNNTYKNAYVKSLAESYGYRYIDFAAAVGAEEAGSSWYAGMLSSDNVHPTALGAKALYARFCIDVPEALK